MRKRGRTRLCRRAVRGRAGRDHRDRRHPRGRGSRLGVVAAHTARRPRPWPWPTDHEGAERAGRRRLRPCRHDRDDALPEGVEDSVTDELAQVRTTEVEGVVHVTLSGDVDLSNADTVQHLLEQAIAGQSVIVVDLSSVTYIDSRGIRLLVQVSRQFREGGGQLTVVAPKETIAGGVLRLIRVDELDLDANETGSASEAQ